MVLKRRDSKGVNYHGALKCEICSKSAVLKDRFYNIHTVQSYYEQSNMNVDKVIVKMTESPGQVVNEADKFVEVEGIP